MASLKQLKTKRESTNKTRKVTRAMEAVSAVKMRKAQERALGGRAYAAAALRILQHISAVRDVSNHPLIAAREQGAYGIVLVTSDKGLAGSLNSAVIKKFESFVGDEKYAGSPVQCVCIGRRGHEYARSRGHTILTYQENKNDEVTEPDMQALTDLVLGAHMRGDTRAWYVIYTNFKSTFEQEAVIRRILPLSYGALEDVIASIVPDTGKYAGEQGVTRTVNAYTIEPSPQDIVELVIPALVNVIAYHALLESKASEHSARMVAMKNATDKAGERSQELLLAFNKARQAMITREVSEITSGIEAMS